MFKINVKLSKLCIYDMNCFTNEERTTFGFASKFDFHEDGIIIIPALRNINRSFSVNKVDSSMGWILTDFITM